MRYVNVQRPVYNYYASWGLETASDVDFGEAFRYRPCLN